jgi:hypothetical protein
MNTPILRAVLLVLLVLPGSAAESPRGSLPGGQDHPSLSDVVRTVVKVDAPVVALTNVRVIDGTGAPSRDGQRLVDLVVVEGDPSRRIAGVRNVETVFKAGVGFDPAVLRDSVRGRAGSW